LSSGFSTVFLQGRIASEPKNKTGYSRFYLDVVERIPDKENEGKWKDRENKILIQLVGKAADKAATLKKNDRVTVAGIFDQMYYEIDAQKRSTLTMKAFRIKKTNTTDPQNLCVVQGHVAFGKDPDTHQRRESSEIKIWYNGQCQVRDRKSVV
jgi:single-stranded DNA-binding protein